MAAFPHIFSLFFITSISLTTLTVSSPTIGVTINHYPQSLTPEKLAAAISRQKITAVRLIDPDPNLIRAFSYSSTSLLLTIPNSLIPSLSANRSSAVIWLYSRVVPFYPRANITSISVGSEPLSSTVDLSDHLLPAIRNVHVALHELGYRKIKVSTTFSLISILTSAFPPSAAEFGEPVNDVIIKPLLDFLEEENSFFMVNLYPYDLYRLDHEIPLGYALFQEGSFNFRDDTTTGVRYRNVFDTMIDALLAAMVVSGHENVPVIVTETGWPWSPGTNAGEESDANLVFAEMYLRGLIGHLKFGGGTLLRKDPVSEVYIYELFDEEDNQEMSINGVPTRQWGILYPNCTSKYNLDFSGANSRIFGLNGYSFIFGLSLSLFNWSQFDFRFKIRFVVDEEDTQKNEL